MPKLPLDESRVMEHPKADPRIARIPVVEIVEFARAGWSVAYIAERIFPSLSVEQVRTALQYAEEHPEKIAAIIRRRIYGYLDNHRSPQKKRQSQKPPASSE